MIMIFLESGLCVSVCLSLAYLACGLHCSSERLAITLAQVNGVLLDSVDLLRWVNQVHVCDEMLPAHVSLTAGAVVERQRDMKSISCVVYLRRRR